MPTPDDDVQRLLADVATHELCPILHGQLVGLEAKNGWEEIPPAAGRLLIRECTLERVGNEGAVRLHIAGIGWQWVDRESSVIGATFEVEQYVGISLSLEMVAVFDVEWLREERLLSIRLLPRTVTADVQPLVEVDADPEGAWGAVVGDVIGAITGESPDERADTKVAEAGARRIRSKLYRGTALIIDLCTGHRFALIGSARGRELPERPADVPPLRWIDTQRAVIHRGGLDVSGPFGTRGHRAVEAHVTMQTGSDPVEVALVCAEEARAIAESFARRRDVPAVTTRATAVVRPGQPVDLRVESPGCDLALSSRPAGELDEPVRLRAVLTSEGDHGSVPDLVACPPLDQPTRRPRGRGRG